MKGKRVKRCSIKCIDDKNWDKKLFCALYLPTRDILYTHMP